MAVITITKENFEAEVLKSAQPVLLDFWALKIQQKIIILKHIAKWIFQSKWFMSSKMDKLFIVQNV